MPNPTIKITVISVDGEARRVSTTKGTLYIFSAAVAIDGAEYAGVEVKTKDGAVYNALMAGEWSGNAIVNEDPKYGTSYYLMGAKPATPRPAQYAGGVKGGGRQYFSYSKDEIEALLKHSMKFAATEFEKQCGIKVSPEVASAIQALTATHFLACKDNGVKVTPLPRRPPARKPFPANQSDDSEMVDVVNDEAGTVDDEPMPF